MLADRRLRQQPGLGRTWPPGLPQRVERSLSPVPSTRMAGCYARSQLLGSTPPPDGRLESRRLRPRRSCPAGLAVRAPATVWPVTCQRVAGAYTQDSVWRNRDQFLSGRAEIIAPLTARFPPMRDSRVQPAGGQRKLLGQIMVRHMCATGEPSNPRPSAGCRKFRPTTSANSS